MSICGIIQPSEVKKQLIEMIEKADIILHPDTEATFAAYQIILQGYDIWVNARAFTGQRIKIISMGKVVNRS